MKVKLGKEGLNKTFQAKFPEEVICMYCTANSRIGFVAHETEEMEGDSYVCQVNEQSKDDKMWLHDLCSVAVYFCEKCLKPTALYNQG